MAKKADKTAEAAELKTLMGQGLPVIIGGKRYTIKEPTLATLDRMSEIWLTFPDIRDDINVAEAMAVARREVHNHARSMAKVVAMAIVGERMFMPIIGRWVLNRMTSKVYHSLKPTELKSLVEIITATNGLVNFAVSIKLMSIAVTTQPKNDIE